MSSVNSQNTLDLPTGAHAAAAADPANPHVIAALEEYLRLCEAGAAPDPQTFTARYPDIRDTLSGALAGLRFMQDAAPQVEASSEGIARSFELNLSDLQPLGDFRIIREIGRGGMGIVYEAEQMSLARRVALKVLPFAAVLDPRHLQRFKNEALAAASLDHPNIVEVYAVGCERGVHFYAMRYVEGQTLAAVIDALRTQDWRAGDVSPPISRSDASRDESTSLPPEEGQERGAASDCVSVGNALSGVPVVECGDSSPLSISNDATSVGNGLRAVPESPNDADPAGIRPSSFALRTSAMDTLPIAALSTLRTHRPRDFFRLVAELGIQAAEALDHAHNLGIVHRDIKPSNLMIEVRNAECGMRNEGSPSPSGRRAAVAARGQGEGAALTTDHRPLTTHLYITDFGLARIESDATLTLTGDLLGTLRYMSPEQAEGRTAILDHRTDIYSLGITLYELATLRPGFPANDRQTLQKQIANDEPLSPRYLNSAIPLDLETIILKATRKVPVERYSTARELADDLRRFLTQRPVKAKRPSPLDRARRWTGQHAALVTTAFVTLAIVTASAVTATVLTKNAYDSEAEQRADAEANLDAAKRNLAQAKANLRLASEAVDNMMAQMAGGPNDPFTAFRAITIFGQATEFHEKLLAESEDAELKVNAAATHRRGAQLFQLIGMPDNAVAELRQASELLAKVVKDHPARLNYIQMLGENELELARFLSATDHHTAAEEPLRRSLSIYERLTRVSLHEPLYQLRLAETLNDLGQFHWHTQRPHEAEKCFTRAAEFSSQLPNQDTGDYRAYEAARLEGALFNNQALLARNEKRFDGAIAFLDQAIAAQERALTLAPNDPWIKDYRYRHHFTRAETFLLAGRYRDAAESVVKLVDVCADQPQAFHQGAELLLSCAEQCGDLPGAPGRDEASVAATGTTRASTGVIEARGTQTSRADEYRQQARDLLAKAPAVPRHTAVTRDHLAWFLLTCSEESFRDSQQALRLAKDVLKVSPQRVSAWRTLALAHYRMGFWHEAEDAMQRVLINDANTSPDAATLLLLAMIRSQQGQQLEARHLYNRATSKIAHGASDEVLSRLSAEASELLTTTPSPARAVPEILPLQDSFPAIGESPFFMAIRGVPGGAKALSPDGRVIVGHSEEIGAFRWKHGGGLERLGFSGTPSALSADGSVIVGSIDGVDGTSRVFRWTEQSGLELLATGSAHGVSHDGSVVVGTLQDRGSHVFRWDRVNGAVRLGELPGTTQSWARAVSANGRVVVGECRAKAFGVPRAYHWTESTGMVEMGPSPPDYLGTVPFAISGNGSIAVGQFILADKSFEAARWSKTTGWIGMGDLEGGKLFSSAHGISDDGRIIIGYATDAEGRKPFVWDVANGMRSVATVLRDDYGVGESLAGLRLGFTIYVSADGQTIAGACIRPDVKTAQPWIAFLPGHP